MKNSIVGMRGFEPPISRPPDEHFNRTKLHPDWNYFLLITFNAASTIASAFKPYLSIN